MSVETAVKEIVVKIVHKPEAEFSSASSFKDLGADSLDVVQILVALEDAFNIEITEDDLKDVKNMGDFVACVERKVAEKK